MGRDTASFAASGANLGGTGEDGVQMAARARVVGDRAGGGTGSRSDGALGVGDLDRLSPGQAEDLVRKDAVWPPPDWKALVAGGMEVRAAALIKLVRDRIPARPNYDVRQLGTHYTDNRTREPALVRRDYVTMLSAVRDAMAACRTTDCVRGARTRALEAVGWTPDAGAETKHVVTSVWRDRLDTLQVDYRDMAKVEAMVREGWPGEAVPTWRRGHSVLSDGEGGHLLARGVRIIADGFRSEAEAWEWLRQDTDARKAADSRPSVPSRPKVADPAREGLPDRRGGIDVSLMEFLDVFGLRTVEFGKWVPQGERQGLLNRTHDALHDLAHALDLDPRAIGLAGTLSLSFGARGNGATKADYDPGLRVLALPRASGAGELASRWALAFDHWAGELGREGEFAAPRLATGRAAKGRGEPVPDVRHLEPAAAAAWERLSATIWRGDTTAGDEAAEARADLLRREEEVRAAERRRDAFLLSNPDARNDPAGAKYLDDLERWLSARQDKVLPPIRRRLADLEALAAEPRESAYAAEARKLCGRDGDFWARPTWMFARVLEARVHDRLTAMGARNEFLVLGADEGRFATGYKGDPYPSGEERRRMGAAVAIVLAAMSPAMAPPPPETDPGVPEASRPGPALP